MPWLLRQKARTPIDDKVTGMTNDFTPASPVALPAHSGVADCYKAVHLADAFSIRLPLNAAYDPELLARFIFASQPGWVAALMGMRDAVAAPFGLKTGRQLSALANNDQASRVGIFKVYNKSDTEIVLGEDDRHLDFRISVLCSGDGGPRRVTVSTVVTCHNRLGRSYLFVIAPFHRMVVKASLTHAARRGWPQA